MTWRCIFLRVERDFQEPLSTHYAPFPIPNVCICSALSNVKKNFYDELTLILKHSVMQRTEEKKEGTKKRRILWVIVKWIWCNLLFFETFFLPDFILMMCPSRVDVRDESITSRHRHSLPSWWCCSVAITRTCKNIFFITLTFFMSWCSCWWNFWWEEIWVG